MKVLCVVLSLCTLLAFSQAHPVNGTYPGGKCDDVRQQCNATLIGAFCPQCDSKGNFLPKQCSGSTGYCWCVDIFSGKEKENTRTPPGTKLNCGGKKRCPDGWTNHGDKCFIFIDTPKRWTDAEVYCRFDGANLASIHSDEENYFITSLTRGDTHDFPQSWLGGFDAIQPGFWLWSDGSEFSYENWHENEPYDDDDDDEEKDEGDEKDDDDEDEDDHDNSDEKHHDDDKDDRNKKDKKNCLRINYEHGLKWFYAPCVDTLPFVCAKKADDDD
ncbi:hypothetical protein Q5P01_002907 [Channa striata]|uniref:Uncharacterized protein n=1 Tax=Channa striata TaxID=64152 RepID=A0AA88T8J6_CHASR|nr:hypothetical protein Q5P01_002907 [Channa striata]